jgi:putative oxidoreductase
MAALQFLSKYRETGLLLIRASLGLIFIILIAPVLWNGSGSWEHFGDAMKHLDFHAHFKVWGFIGAVLGCAGGVLMILGLFFESEFCSCSRSRLFTCSRFGIATAISTRGCRQ